MKHDTIDGNDIERILRELSVDESITGHTKDKKNEWVSDKLFAKLYGFNNSNSTVDSVLRQLNIYDSSGITDSGKRFLHNEYYKTRAEYKRLKYDTELLLELMLHKLELVDECDNIKELKDKIKEYRK